MLVIAHHFVQNPEFWSTAQRLMAESGVPQDLKLHAVYPSTDGKTGTCLWEANSAADVQDYLDKNLSQFASNVTYEVDEAAAIGTPQKTMTAELA